MNRMTISTAILVAAALTLTGCSASSQAVTVGDAPAATTPAAPVESGAKEVLTPAQATATLVTADQVGTGWITGTNSTSTSTNTPGDTTFAPASCPFGTVGTGLAGIAGIAGIDLVDPAGNPVAETKADFTQAPTAGAASTMDLHAVNVSVKSYPDDVDVSKLKGISTKLLECAKFTSTDSGGVTSSFEIFPTSLPNYGDGTLAFRLQGPVSMFIVLVDFVTIVSGHNIVTISQTGLGKIDTALAGHVAEQVMANLDTATK
jgi:hypothetical protein